MLGFRLMQLQAAYSSVTVRLFLIAAGIGMLWLHAEHPDIFLATLWASYAGLVFALGMVGRRMGHDLLDWRHRRDWLYPLAYALRPALRLSDIVPAQHIARIPRDFGTNPKAQVIVNLPADFVGDDDDETGSRKKIAFIVLEKLGLTRGDVNVFWVMSSKWHYLQITLKQKLHIPARVSFGEVKHLIERCESGRHLLAVGRHPAGQEITDATPDEDNENVEPILIKGNLDGHAPHVGLSMRTGGGKSNQLKGIVAQEMHHGASAHILDYKRRSLKAFKGVEGVVYCRDIGEIHNALLALAREAMERNVLADELGDDEEPPWQRRLVVVEEQNSMLKKLRRYWEEIRESHEPRTSPAVDAYEELLFMGRQVNVHIVASFQKLTVRAAGSTEARDQFGMIIMSLFKPSAWKMLADDLPMPNIAGKPTGRSWYVSDGEAPEGQPILWTDKEARAWAESGKSSKIASRGVRQLSDQGRGGVIAAGEARLQLVPADAGRAMEKVLLSISEASADRGQQAVGLSYQALRTARVRDPEFPQPDEVDGQTLRYRPETLQRWERNREQAGVSS